MKMRKILSGALELACGLPLVAAGLVGGFLFLQSRSLVYLLFPMLSVLAAGLGYWRGRRSKLPSRLVAVLLNLPLFLTILWFLTERAWGLLALPAVAALFSSLGIAAARSDAPASAGRISRQLLLPLLLVNVAMAFAIPRFVSTLIISKQVTQPAKPFRLAPIQGAAVTSGQLLGRVVVLDFWATWCGPCRREFPVLDRVVDHFSGQPDVVFYAVNGARGDTPEEALRYFREMRYRPIVAFDPGHEVQTALSVRGFPSLVVIDRAGRIRMRHVGFLGAEDLEGKLRTLIERLLSEKAVA
jgi:thiol-disulfide isomerase/thioredoxin